jgi:NTP pyrophosphatase (non-canonical NTP hydrolase)
MRDEKELQKLYKDCMEFWGFEKQARVVQEECAELIVATSHILRGRKGGYKKMLEEVADVYLMVQQMMTYFGKDQVMDVVDFKSDRVKDKLEKYKENSNAN